MEGRSGHSAASSNAVVGLATRSEGYNHVAAQGHG
jgi:hypothetical protein